MRRRRCWWRQMLSWRPLLQWIWRTYHHLCFKSPPFHDTCSHTTHVHLVPLPMLSSVEQPQIIAPESSHVQMVTSTLPVLSTTHLFQTTWNQRLDSGAVKLRLMQEATARKNVLTLGEITTGMVHAKMTKSAGVFSSTIAIRSKKVLTRSVPTSPEPTLSADVVSMRLLLVAIAVKRVVRIVIATCLSFASPSWRIYATVTWRISSTPPAIICP